MCDHEVYKVKPRFMERKSVYIQTRVILIYSKGIKKLKKYSAVDFF